MSVAPAVFADAPLTGGLEGTRMLAALALSLGLHAGVAAFLDLPGRPSMPAQPGAVQVRLVHSGARTVLSPATPGDALTPATAPVAARATRPAVTSPDDASLPTALPAPPPSTPLRPVAPAAAVSVATLMPLRGAAPAPRSTVTRTHARPDAREDRGSTAAPARALASAPEPPGPATDPPRPPARAAPARPGALPGPAPPASAALPPRPLSDNPRPRYPMLARRRGQEGSVLVRLDVDARGTPSSARVITSSGVASLDEAARDAVSRWRFEPARRAGQAEAATVDVPVEFRLDGSG